MSNPGSQLAKVCSGQKENPDIQKRRQLWLDSRQCVRREGNFAQELNNVLKLRPENITFIVDNPDKCEKLAKVSKFSKVLCAAKL